MKQRMLICLLLVAVLLVTAVSPILANTQTTIEIDIKPGSDLNPLNVKSRGVLPVAILGAEDFDTTEVDPETLKLVNQRSQSGKTESDIPLRWSWKDINRDGWVDMVCHFDAEDLMTICPTGVPDRGNLNLLLVGYLKDGSTEIMGQDTVMVINKDYAGP